MGRLQESVLYYRGDKETGDQQVRLLKSVFVRMGIRIKNIRQDQVLEQVGYLAGMPGFSKREDAGEETAPNITRDMLVLHQFTSARVDQLLLNLQKAGVPKVDLKAVITPQNAGWTFYHLYEELKEEHEKLHEL